MKKVILMLTCVGCVLKPMTILREKGKEEISLLEAAGDGKCEEIKALLEVGVNIDATDYSGSTALMKASQKGHVEVYGAPHV